MNSYIRWLEGCKAVGNNSSLLFSPSRAIGGSDWSMILPRMLPAIATSSRCFSRAPGDCLGGGAAYSTSPLLYLTHHSPPYRLAQASPPRRLAPC
ncbi:hypothetical protein J0A67_04265 [Algoriphagus aestuariicola]|uniref:Uncharacterized protein n=1 Tax=Algoriphagus aestuariicola TaxID=1852016 RepID=A0ABS3BP86_9BACT|nr:hypothetical protein [Algoriphagus aestuariicola]MBN7800061.1 hypothetical protein [Algoriphagus aestuariicola]